MVRRVRLDDLVFLVTQSEAGLDDYRVVYVFRNEDAAHRHVELWNTYWNDRYPGQGSMTRQVEAHEIVSDEHANHLFEKAAEYVAQEAGL